MTMAKAGAPWQLVLEKVEQRCGYLLTSGLWSDCTFVVGSETNQAVVLAHKLVLAMASPVFEAMFYGELKERNDSALPIPDVQPEAFRALLQYIYTGNITIVSFDMAWDLWYGAKKYMLPFLCFRGTPRDDWVHPEQMCYKALLMMTIQYKTFESIMVINTKVIYNGIFTMI